MRSTENRRFSLGQLVCREMIGSVRVELSHNPITIVFPTPTSLTIMGLSSLPTLRRRPRA
jgi:hypothetical protein